MAGYLGHKPKLTNFTVDEFTTSAAQASSGNFTLSQTVTDSKTLEVSVGGIDQPQSAYSVSGTTLAFGASIIAENDTVIARHFAGDSIMYPALEDSAVTSAKVANNAVTSSKIIDNAVISSKIIDNAVTNAKTNFQPGTAFKGDGSSADGKITLNCSQNTHGVSIQSPAHSAGASYTITLPVNDGNADEFLKTNGSGVTSWGEAGGGMHTLLSTQTATNVTSVDITSGFTSTYESYLIKVTNGSVSINATEIYMRVGTGATPTWQTGSNYKFHVERMSGGGAEAHTNAHNTDRISLTDSGIGNTGVDSWNFNVYIFNPASTTKHTMVMFDGMAYAYQTYAHRHVGGGAYGAATAVTAYRFYPGASGSSGYISGTFKLYGIS